MGRRAEQDVVYKRLTCCDQCEFCEKNPDYTDDSFERPERWDCKHPKLRRKDKNIVRYQEWNDSKPGIPNWCPLRRLKPNKR
jgi:hypothetical protein